MSVVPAFEIGLWNAWLFMSVFLLQWLAVIVLPKGIVQRTGHPEDLKLDSKGKTIAKVTELFWIGAIIYSIFLPLETGTAWFYIGLGLFIIGVIILILATINVTKAKPNKPFTKGAYYFSRHPMYLSMIFIYTGVSIATASWLFFLITTVTFFLQRYQAIQEEIYCSRRYGRDYNEYINTTPRWIGIPKS